MNCKILALLLLLPLPALAQSPTPTSPTPTSPTPTSQAPTSPPPTTGSPGDPAQLQQALRNFPPPILVNNVHAVAAGEAIPPSCPAAGSRVEQKGGPTLEFLGAKPENADLCRMRVEGQEFDAWYGIWATTWPGAEFAYRAINRTIHGKTGDVVGFDTIAAPGVAEWHEFVRNDGVEDIRLLDKTYRALKLAHYREGFNGNTYRSVATLWVDLKTGLPIYATYQHISGKPELDGPLIPTAIVPAP